MAVVFTLSLHNLDLALFMHCTGLDGETKQATLHFFSIMLASLHAAIKL